MPGTGTITPSAGPPGGIATPLVVSRYDPTADTHFFVPVPNVECLQIQRGRGASPSVARFRYRMATPQLNPGWPSRIEQIFGLDAIVGPYVLGVDERIVVTTIDPPMPGSTAIQYTVLFDGTCQVPQMDASGDTEQVTFQAVGIEMRCWETPVGQATFRSGPDLTVNDGSADVPDLRTTRFNPDGWANATALGFWSGGEDPADEDEEEDGDPEEGGGKGGEDDEPGEDMSDDGPTDTLYPVFMRTPTDGIRDRKYFQLWTLSMVVRYLLAVYNGKEEFVKNPLFGTLTAILDSFEVKDGVDFDPTNPDTYTEEPITVEDYDATGDPWPVAIEKVISPYGYGMQFVLDEDEDGKPRTTLQFFRTDAANGIGPKYVFLAQAGSGYDPSTSNVTEVSINRDVAAVFNQVELDTELIRHEIGVVLAPAPWGNNPDTWGIDPADVHNIKNYTVGDPAFTGNNVDKYRTFIFDEDGVGHWDFDKNMVVVGFASGMDTIFGKPAPPPDDPFADPIPKYACIPRKPLGTLFSRRIVDGDRLRAQLHVSRNPGATGPYVWASVGDWQLVKDGTWELLPDRIGIRFTVENPNDLFVG